MSNNIAKNFYRQISTSLKAAQDFVVRKPISVLLIAIVVLMVAQIIRMAIWANDYPNWVGFSAYNESKQGVRAKTLWDWMELLLVPATLALGAFFLNRIQTENDRRLTQDNQRQKMLDTYFDKISELLLMYNLRGSIDGEAGCIARSRTLSLFRHLDGDRKGDVLQFLYESELLYVEKGIDLIGADLSASILQGATLNSVKLKGTNLSYANLNNANLIDAELEGINLSNAMLQNCNFRNAKLKGANFQSADLHQAIFDGADLSDADFLGAKVDIDSLEEAKNLNFAVMNDGKIYESDR